jgi:hypothetical protein
LMSVDCAPSEPIFGNPVAAAPRALNEVRRVREDDWMSRRKTRLGPGRKSKSSIEAKYGMVQVIVF